MATKTVGGKTRPARPKGRRRPEYLREYRWTESGEELSDAPASLTPLQSTETAGEVRSGADAVQIADTTPDVLVRVRSAPGEEHAAPSHHDIHPKANASNSPEAIAAPKSAEVPSTAKGIVFCLSADGQHQVQCEVRQAETLLASFAIHDASEKAIGFRLASLALPYPSSVYRELDAARLLANVRRLMIDGEACEPAHDPIQAAATILDSNNPVALIREDLVQLGFRADPDVGLTLYLAKISALIDKPLYVYVVGPASSLKTTYADTTARLMPPEVRKHLTELTKKALYYGQPQLSHFGVFLDELDVKGSGLAVDLKVLREMYSKGWCEIEVTLGGKAVRRRIDGPVFVVQTTTAVTFDEQDVSRRLVIDLPDDPGRTEVILTMMGEHYAGKSPGESAELITDTHQALHRMLPVGCGIDIPYAPALARLLPKTHMTVLRSFSTLASLIKASALLHLRHRQMDAKNHLTATLDDYRLVYQTAGKYIAQSMNGSGLSTPTRQWIEALLESLASRDLKKAEAGTSRDLAELERLGRDRFLADHKRWDRWLGIEDLEDLTGRPRSTVQRYLAQLAQAGFIEQQREKRKLTYRLATANAQLPTCPGLPTPEEVEREHLGSCRKSSGISDLVCPLTYGQQGTEGKP